MRLRAPSGSKAKARAEPLATKREASSCALLDTIRPVQPHSQHQPRRCWFLAICLPVVGRFVVVTEEQISGRQPQVVAELGMVQGPIEAVEGLQILWLEGFAELLVARFDPVAHVAQAGAKIGRAHV